jgi:penicillin-insensitive murein endopeptidase
MNLAIFGTACSLDDVRRTAFALALALVGIIAPSAAAPAGPRSTHKAPRVPTPPATLSIGSPTDGHLENAMRLDGSSSLRVVPIYAPRDVRYGLPDLVKTLERASLTVAKRFPGAVMTVGDLSKHHGGEVDRHVSHESGRDADVGFYVVDEKGKQVLADQFIAFDAQGRGKGSPHLRFDEARNWSMIAGLLGGPAQVQYLFIASYLRTKLLAEATRVKAPAALRTRAAELMVEPRGVLPHDDHVHVRVHCPAGMKSCVDWPTPKSAAVARRKPTTKTTARASAPLVIAVPLTVPDHTSESADDANDSVDDADGELSSRGRAGR